MLKDKVALVTGAGCGIGREIAILLSKNGAKGRVNDLVVSATGVGGDRSPADEPEDLAEIIPGTLGNSFLELTASGQEFPCDPLV